MKLKRTARESWGVWENRDHMLVHHKINKRTPVFIHAAWVNPLFSVQASTHATDWGDVLHLWIKRHDEKPLVWRDMQRIKNELVGPDRVAVEIYPPATELVDSANMYHLWVLPAGFVLPFTLRGDRHDPA